MIKFTTKFPEFMQQLFGCKEEDTFTLSVMSREVQILHLGDQNIPIYQFKADYKGVSFIFVDPAGTLLMYEYGNVFPVLNENMQETIPDLLLSYIKN